MRVQSLVLLPLAILLLHGCGGDSPTEELPPKAPVATAVMVVSGSDQTGTVGELLGQPLVVKVLDDEGRPLPGATVHWTATAGSLASAASITDGSGLAEALWTLGTRVGQQHAAASVANLPELSFRATAVAAAPSVLRASKDSIAFAAAGDTVRLAAQVFDRYQNELSAYTLAWSSGDTAVATVDGTGRVTSRGAGRTTIRIAAGVARADVGVSVTPQVASVEFDRTAVALSALGDTLRVGVVARDRNGNVVAGAGPASWELVAESRWVDAIPVLDATALARGTLRAAGAGRTTVRVRLQGAVSPALPVSVSPVTPVVQLFSAPAVVTTRDTLVLRGYALDRLGATAITFGGRAAVVVARDSATTRVLPPVSATGCEGAAQGSLAVAGAVVQASLALRLERAGELDLPVGGSQVIEDGCIRLAPHPDAQYALAFVDTRAIEKARTQWEGYTGVFPDYSVSIADRSVPASAARAPAAAVAAAGPGDAVFADAALSAAAPWSQSTPWRAGDRFTMYDDVTRRDRAVRVLRLYDDYFVIAVFEEDTAFATPKYLAQMDSAMPEVIRHSIPAFEMTFEVPRPVTSAGSGQILYVLRQDPVSRMTNTRVNGQVLARVELQAGDGLQNAAHMAAFITHELTHAYQVNYMASVGGGGPGAAVWAVEGTASFFGSEVNRRAAGVGLLDNWNFMGPHTTNAQMWYSLSFRTGTGLFSEGYGHSGQFFTDLIVRLMRAGASEETAFREVLRGSLEGWFGYVGNTRHTGLAARMRRHLGDAWDPADALLIWALSRAADDRTSSDVFQDRSGLETWRATGTYQWNPLASLLSGNGAVLDVTRKYESPGFLYISDPDVGGSWALSSDIPEVRWMLVRIR